MKTTRARLASQRASLRDVAEAAGVSAAAVSYVVNGRTKEVSQETLVRIREAITALKYQPHRRGLSLRYNREFSVGLVIVDPDPNFLADPFTTYVATGLSNGLLEPGYAVTVTGCRNKEDVARYLSRPIGVDGYVVLASGPKEERQEVYGLLSSGGLPLVIIQEEVPDDLSDGCAIMQEDGAGAAALTRLVLEKGASRFVFVAPSRQWPAVERRSAGIQEVLAGKFDFRTVHCDEQNFDATVETIDALFGKTLDFDVILCANDQIAIAALKVTKTRNIRVPEDIQLTGYNDFAFRKYVSPSITSVSSNALEMGRRCADVLLRRLETGSFTERSVRLNVHLRPGQTTRQT
jgi:DNA-binding LacI/PurR family transcriptional regulator